MISLPFPSPLQGKPRAVPCDAWVLFPSISRRVEDDRQSAAINREGSYGTWIIQVGSFLTALPTGGSFLGIIANVQGPGCTER